ncbi:putative RNA exonuclease 1 DEDDh 3'-5' exonuclease domain protein [Mycena chlorophos]|uniref:Putative RNA exonuclease 1 DEDDh 3'-5' exonuclease domain protein n=1 Tax=Mycena chlorophos TaxID=658473 RepID=A0A8H6T165_MYCCL|nr:putative RNA exonuclease 1 DEDDh 3'-5' exonuclease domain protein [Mycena chlorophos]
MDKFVVPVADVVDYRFFETGIVPADLESGTFAAAVGRVAPSDPAVSTTASAASFEEVRREAALLMRGRIVVGHSIWEQLSVRPVEHLIWVAARTLGQPPLILCPLIVDDPVARMASAVPRRAQPSSHDVGSIPPMVLDSASGRVLPPAIDAVLPLADGRLSPGTSSFDTASACDVRDIEWMSIMLWEDVSASRIARPTRRGQGWCLASRYQNRRGDYPWTGTGRGATVARLREAAAVQFVARGKTSVDQALYGVQPRPEHSLFSALSYLMGVSPETAVTWFNQLAESLPYSDPGAWDPSPSELEDETRDVESSVVSFPPLALRRCQRLTVEQLEILDDVFARDPYASYLQYVHVANRVHISRSKWATRPWGHQRHARETLSGGVQELRKLAGLVEETDIDDSSVLAVIAVVYNVLNDRRIGPSDADRDEAAQHSRLENKVALGLIEFMVRYPISVATPCIVFDFGSGTPGYPYRRLKITFPNRLDGDRPAKGAVAYVVVLEEDDNISYLVSPPSDLSPTSLWYLARDMVNVEHQRTPCPDVGDLKHDAVRTAPAANEYPD